MPAPGTAAPIPYRPDDKPFVYATGEHRPAHATTPLWSSYGSRSSTSRVVYLVGDSMAAQHADGLRAATKSRGWGLKPRTRSGRPFVLPATDSYNKALYRQIHRDRARRPIVVLSGIRSSSAQLRATLWRLRYVGADVVFATATTLSRTTSASSTAPMRAVAREKDVPLLETDELADRGYVQKGVVVWRGVGNHTTGSFSRRILTWHDNKLIGSA
jgi:hypothetical protein